MSHQYRLYDFHTENIKVDNDRQGDKKDFIIQMFAMNSQGETAMITISDFRPFFFVKVGQTWGKAQAKLFLSKIKQKLRDTDRYCKKDQQSYYEDSILNCEIVHKKTLYGFDQGKTYTFIKLTFANTTALNKVKNLWYYMPKNTEAGTDPWKKRKLQKWIMFGIQTELYEARLLPLLRFFHIHNISPTGWIELKSPIEVYRKKTTCDKEYIVSKDDIIPLLMKEDPIPLKICSFDIEASSSHGDFPLAKKNYEKLAIDILDCWDKYTGETLLQDIILSAFGYGDIDEVHEIFPKQQPTFKELEKMIIRFLSSKGWIKKTSSSITDYTVLDYLNDESIKRGDKFTTLCTKLTKIFPSLEGDKITFIGSTFKRMGESENYLNHCAVLNSCDKIENATIDCCHNEKDLLLKWTELIKRENPDIIIGYNIFGFDWKFMFLRAEELNCQEEFLLLSKIIDKKCSIKKKTIVIASGEHNLEYPEIVGRVQIDLYNYFRRQYNFSSYKLDNVSSQLIGDKIKAIERKDNKTIVKTSNGIPQGLKKGNYIYFEESGNSTEMYENGLKLKVCEITNDGFCVEGNHSPDLENKSVRWCLAKDDVTPHDIFELSNGSDHDRSIVGKYCIQDCNLVALLADKIDIYTGMFEIGNICSIPFSFVVLRGQGIKLFSFISKKCYSLDTLIPTLPPSMGNEGYEGAICLTPKCNLYDVPVAVVDYASLYPSSMISENLSHDSKVWTKEFDLEGNLIKETGDKKYDNLENYKYEDIEYDRFEYRRKTPKSAAVKVKVGTKICRFAQFPNNEMAIMPSILTELLKARKSTRNLIKYKTVTTEKKELSGLVSKKGEQTIVKLKNGDIVEIDNTDILSIKDTYNDFMKNVFDKRQQGYKITANSLYGQCGAKTSDFYDKDIAAATTATGRKLLMYAKSVIEGQYKDKICDTKHGKVMVRGECIYGDTDSCFFTFDPTDLDGNKIIGKKSLEITIELAQEVGCVATKKLKPPHDLEYEKTFYPFALFAKKRYVGMMYEFDPNKCKRKSMGIVLKRRDNAPIVKEVYGGVIDILMRGENVNSAVQFVQNCLEKLGNGDYPMNKLVITKSLRGFYKVPEQIAHKVLANRIAKRDPGNKPSTGTRIPYVYIVKKGAKLQGDRIETPEFIKEHKLNIDYTFYITNQLLKPLLQIFILENIMNQLNCFRPIKQRMLKNKIDSLVLSGDKLKKKIEDLKGKVIKQLIFDPIIKKIKNKQNNGAKRDFINKFFT